MHKLIDTRDWSESEFILRHPLNTDCRVMSLMLKMTGNPKAVVRVEKNLNLQDALKPHMRISMKSS